MNSIELAALLLISTLTLSLGLTIFAVWSVNHCISLVRTDLLSTSWLEEDLVHLRTLLVALSIFVVLATACGIASFLMLSHAGSRVLELEKLIYMSMTQ